MSTIEISDTASISSRQSELPEDDTPQWNLFLDCLVDRIRAFAMGIRGKEAEEDPLTPDQFLDLEERLQGRDADMSHAEMIIYAKQTRLNILPPELIYQLLDRLFNFQREDEENLDLVSLHTLHSLRQASPQIYEIVEEYMSDSAQKWIKFKEYELDFYRNRDHVRDDPAGPWQLDVYKIPDLDKTRVPIQAITSCCECFAILDEFSLISAEGFDSNGKSFLAWAIEKNHQFGTNWIIDQVPAESEFWKPGSEVGEENHALRLLVEASNSDGFHRLWSKLIVADALETSDLDWMHSDYYKLKLCTFVTGELANIFLDDHEINIGDVGKYYLDSPQSRDGERPLRTDDDPSPVTTSWHEAAKYNPNENILIFLDEHSGIDPNIRNRLGLTPIMYAAEGENSIAVQWLSLYADPLVTLPSRPETQFPYALKAVAQNHSYNSDTMWEAMLDALPTEAFDDFLMAQKMFNFIIDGLWAAGFEPRDPHPQPPLPENRIITMFLAAEKCQQLTNRLPERWEDSLEQVSVTARARNFGYSFLPPSMIRRRYEANTKPGRPELPKPKPTDDLFTNFASLFRRRPQGL
ncbi:hypothetical protein N7456_008257 [Penicillium angulare]|uniref:Uncharacterized protein n=1 Tax=Penicillium angulare TaxID=116970 RepID=A0A9W9FC58_9EURO|nr:hypothetical protein N7456_008257 [Penicillium angulare]